MNLADTYTARALAGLRYRVAPHVTPQRIAGAEDGSGDFDVDPAAEQAYLDALDDKAAEYAEELFRAHEDAVEVWQDVVEVDEDGHPDQAAPDMFADGLATISSTIAELEAYRRALVIFGQRYATQTYSQRQLARLAGVDVASINRWLKDTAGLRARVHGEVQPLALAATKNADLTQLTGAGGARLAELLSRLLRVASSSPDEPAKPAPATEVARVSDEEYADVD